MGTNYNYAVICHNHWTLKHFRDIFAAIYHGKRSLPFFAKGNAEQERRDAFPDCCIIRLRAISFIIILCDRESAMQIYPIITFGSYQSGWTVSAVSLKRMELDWLSSQRRRLVSASHLPPPPPATRYGLKLYICGWWWWNLDMFNLLSQRQVTHKTLFT